MLEKEKHLLILGLEPNATPEEIKQAYKDFASVWHPDRFQGNPRLQEKASKQTQLINAAFEFLKAVEKGTNSPTSSPVAEKESSPNPKSSIDTQKPEGVTSELERLSDKLLRPDTSLIISPFMAIELEPNQYSVYSG